MKKIYIIAFGFLLSLGGVQSAFAAASAEDLAAQHYIRLGEQLIKAIKKNDLPKVKKLIDLGSNVDFQSEKYNHVSPLMWASKLGFVDIVHLLLESKAWVFYRDASGNDALIYAVHGGYDDIVRILISSGADIDTHNNNGETCLTVSVSKNGRFITRDQMTDVIQRSLEKFQHDQRLGKELIKAIKSRDIEETKKLIALNAPVDFHPAKYELAALDLTPLMLASDQNLFDIVSLLLEAGANPSKKKCMGGNTALMKCLESKQCTVDMVKMLLEGKAEVNIHNNHGDTSLIVASTNYRLCNNPVLFEIIDLLINAHVVINAQNKEGKTALIHAVENGHSDMTRTLIFAGADCNIMDDNNDTALTVPILSRYGNEFIRKQMHKQMVDIITEALRVKGLSMELGQHLPRVIVEIILDYDQEEKQLHPLQKKLIFQKSVLLLSREEKENNADVDSESDSEEEDDSSAARSCVIL